MIHGKLWLHFLRADSYQDHVTPTLRKHNVHSRILDPTFNKYSRSLHGAAFFRVTTGGEGNLLSVIRSHLKMMLLTQIYIISLIRLLRQNTGGTSVSGRQKNPIQISNLCRPRALTDRGSPPAVPPGSSLDQLALSLWQAHPLLLIPTSNGSYTADQSRKRTV